MSSLKSPKNLEKKRRRNKLSEQAISESDVKTKLTPKNAFEYFQENPTLYLSKLIKKHDYNEGCAVLEEIILQLESLSAVKINEFDKDD